MMCVNAAKHKMKKTSHGSLGSASSSILRSMVASCSQRTLISGLSRMKLQKGSKWQTKTCKIRLEVSRNKKLWLRTFKGSSLLQNTWIRCSIGRWRIAIFRLPNFITRRWNGSATLSTTEKSCLIQSSSRWMRHILGRKGSRKSLLSASRLPSKVSLRSMY